MHPISVSLILFLILIAVLLGFGYPIIRGLWLRFRIRRWIKMLTGARMARQQKRFSEADQFLQQALDVCNQLPRHWKVKAVTYSELASLYCVQGNYREAERFRRDELSLREKFDGSRAPETVVATSNLATLLDDAGKSAEAEPLHQQAVEFLQQIPGLASQASNCMNNYARCLHKLGRVDESARLYQQSMALAKQAGTDGPVQSANGLNNLAVAMSDTARYAEAEALHREVLATRQKEAGPESLSAAASLTNLGSVKMRQGEYAEAEELLVKAKEIRDK